MWTFLISIRYFLSKRKEGMISLISAISIIGVALGVAALIIVLSIMNGFDDEVKNKIIGTYAHLVVMNEEGIAGYESLIDEIKSLEGVENVSEFINGQAILQNKDNISGIILKGINADKESDVTNVINYAGGAVESLTPGTIILGKELMKNENIAIGDTVEIFRPYSAVDIRKNSLKVIGEFNSGRYDYDANMAIIDITTARDFFKLENAITGVGVRLKDAMAVSKAKRKLQTMVGYQYTVKSWMDLDRNLVAALSLEKKMMFIILTLIVMVACFNISGSLVMIVMEKGRDIGILKAIGATRMGISVIFLMQGVLIGLAGVVAGGLAGMYLSGRINDVSAFIEKITGAEIFPSDVYYFTEIPVKTNVFDICVIIGMAIFLSTIAGVYPAWKASRLDPVEAIRYE